MTERTPVRDLKESIKALRNCGAGIYIKSLQFPNYKNLEFDSEIQFQFPITVLLGRNGTNKSSILHALYGSPRGNSVADFWFATELDSIPMERDGRKQSIIHSYLDEKEEKVVQCIKMRAPRDGDLDYWEPVKHTKVYGLPESGVRISPIEIKVTHLDFRGELTAFDKYFYFPDEKHLLSLQKSQRIDKPRRRKYSKQDYLRSRYRYLKNALERDGIDLTNEELSVLEHILEKKYQKGRILQHSFFHGYKGWTIVFQTGQDHGLYSDAFAGSGESSAVLLVHNILKAPPKSLILLDEPETSLHPRAQQRMLEFIADQSLKKKLQVVISTHSFYFAERLPQEAIRVLMINDNNRVTIRSDLSAHEALHEISSSPAGKTIFVEDSRSKHIVESILRCYPDPASQDFKVCVGSGGTSRLYLDMMTYAKSDLKNIFFILDGDHQFDRNEITPEKLPQNLQDLKNLVQKVTKGNNDAGPKKLTDMGDQRKYLEFLRNFVYFLPDQTPEHFVWDDQKVQELLGKNVPLVILNEKDFKTRLNLVAEQKPGLDAETVFKLLLSAILDDRGENQQNSKKKKLMDLIEEIRKVE
jgi:predicted ATPase